MSASTSESPVRGNRAKAKSTSGWTAFDLKQRRKRQGLESDNDSEAYPLLSGSSTPQSLFNKDGTLLEKPFSSVVVASMNFPNLIDAESRNLQSPLQISNSCLGTAQTVESAVSLKAYQKLNNLHPWADGSLIRDILAAVNNNIDQASSILEAMLVSGNDDAENLKVKEDVNDFASFHIQGVTLGEKSDMRDIANDPFNDNNSYKETKDEASSLLLLDAAKSLPIEPEPEWEEDDIYLIHRKDAVRMIRSASRHSKAANDAYIRGNHISARLFSLKAQEEWNAAEKLNAKAAKEILTIRNSKNDLWTLDLHGLHASEAVEALHERLQTVESLASPGFTALNGVHMESDLLLAASVQSTTHVKVEKFGRQHPSLRQRPRLLQVITGKGNHSREAAALPSAIRNYLSENGYHFDETRPGAIMVLSKFRQPGVGNSRN
ncbi:hypothetical protein CDL12_07292 [Handroanthus impetiginosus]|uniref:Smr domain-containing protein n=1 Tax=Handroanthus impetiginosus TaxID=429701 RepID=A0A2G9HR78_9LAMI|nr:hypothetical protein CDL12_07292 [Handroanthus impetiginosus]